MKAWKHLCLALTAFVFAAPALAELKYLEYDLEASTGTPVENPDVLADDYHSGTKILFVQDTTVSKDYYIGVFELTEAQAKKVLPLGLKPATVTGAAYAIKSNSDAVFEGVTLPTGLHFPTHEQWFAYTEDPPTSDTYIESNLNMADGFYNGQNVATWYTNYLLTGILTHNGHGVYDIYGNVAEYVSNWRSTEGAIGSFFGGAFTDQVRQLSGSDKLCEKGRKAETYTQACLGVRLVYVEPPPATYAVKVTLNGKDVTTTCVGENANFLEGAEVTVTPPTPLTGWDITACTITPESLATEVGTKWRDLFTFNMPGDSVTIAYTSMPYVTVKMAEGSRAELPPPEGTDAPVVFEEKKFYESATMSLDTLTGRYEKLVGWTVSVDDGEPTPITDEAGAYLHTYTLPEVTAEIAGTVYTLAPIIELVPYAKFEIVEGEAEVFENENAVRRSRFEAVVGDRVTLIPYLKWSQSCRGWEGLPECVELDENGAFTVTEALCAEGGASHTITAIFKYYPRVLIAGGSISGSSGKDPPEYAGPNHFLPGTTVYLKHHTEGDYLFHHWSDGTNEWTEDEFTVPDEEASYGTTFYIMGHYGLDDEEEGGGDPTDPPIALGTTDGKPNPLFGYEPGETPVDMPDGYGNTFRFFAYAPADVWAKLPLTGTDRTIDYVAAAETSTGVTNPGSMPQLGDYETVDAWQEAYDAWMLKRQAWLDAGGITQEGGKAVQLDPSVLLMRRVMPGDGNDFYLGVFETPIGNVANLEALTGGSSLKGQTSSKLVYYGLALNDNLPYPYPFSGCLELIKKAFNLEATLPTKDDIRIAAGEGAGVDSSITQDMVVVKGTGLHKDLTSDGMTIDPYGFFGMWGNCWESVAGEDNLYGNYAATDSWTYCSLMSTMPNSLPQATRYASFRPKIMVQKPITVTIGYDFDGDGAAEETVGEIQAAPGALFEDGAAEPKRAGFVFEGWTLSGQDDLTLTAEQCGTTVTLVGSWKTVSTSIDFTCVNCDGPKVGYPGMPVTVYAQEGYRFAEENPLTVDPANVVDGEITLSEDRMTVTFMLKSPIQVEDTVTLTGNQVPIEGSKPGYRFRLR